MMKNKKDIRLHNVLFPIWSLMFFPQMWLIVLPGNFIIDSAVLLIILVMSAEVYKWDYYKEHIWKIFGIGMLSDFLGAGCMFVLMYFFDVGNMGDEPYLVIPGIIISAVSIFILNFFITFKDDNRLFRFTASVIFAVVTAPYTFLIPSSWLYADYLAM